MPLRSTVIAYQHRPARPPAHAPLFHARQCVAIFLLAAFGTCTALLLQRDLQPAAPAVAEPKSRFDYIPIELIVGESLWFI